MLTVFNPSIHDTLLSPNPSTQHASIHKRKEETMDSAPLNPLKPIGKGIYYFQPTEPEPEPEPPTSPSLITLCTWVGGATPQRIQKYIAGYRALYPDSAILLITTNLLEISALPFSAIRARLAPARDVVRQVVSADTGVSSDTGTNNGRILLHLFSNGGCNIAIQLALSLRTDPGHPALDMGRYLGGIIFDSCPGVAPFKRVYESAALSLPSSVPAKAVGTALLYPFIGVVFGLQHTGWMSSSQDIRVRLNDPGVLGETAARLYLYSTADQVFGSEDVESHLDEARSKLGCTVQGVAFPDSPHCALVRDHPGRYWNEINRFWVARVPDSLHDKPRSRL